MNAELDGRNWWLLWVIEKGQLEWKGHQDDGWE